MLLSKGGIPSKTWSVLRGRHCFITSTRAISPRLIRCGFQKICGIGGQGSSQTHFSWRYVISFKTKSISSRRCLLLLKMTAFYPIGDVLSKTGKRLAIPLCLPNNCRWDSKKSQYLQTGEKRHSLYVVEEALEKLRRIKGTLFTKVL